MTERNTRLLAAIMFTDIEGYTALMQHNEAAAVRLRDQHRRVMDKFHKKHKGKIVQYYGDGSLSIFNSCVEAVKCAISIQQELRDMDPQVPLRIGIHLGDIIERDDDIIGNGVNIASRIEGLSVPGSVLISRKVADEITNQSEIKLKPMGHFSFKNSNTPTEVLAIDEEGLIVPIGKSLEGKFTKRKGVEKNFLQRLPLWAKYLGGFALLAFLVPLAINMLSYTEGTASQETITLFDEFGQQFNVPLIESKDIKRIYSVPFNNEDPDNSLNWLSLGFPYALAMDWSQDPRLFNVYNDEVLKESFNKNLNTARSEKCDYLLQGSYRKNQKTYEVKITIHQTSNGKLIDEVSYSNASLFTLLDTVSSGIKEAFRITRQLNNIVELPISQFLTNSERAFQKLCEGIILQKTNPRDFSGIHTLISQSVKTDPEFAWGHFYLSQFHHKHHISPNVASNEIELAMRFRDKMPENQNAQIRQLHYRIKGKGKEALVLSEFLHKSRPNNSVLLNNLILEYYQQNAYQKTIDYIEKFRTLQSEPSAFLNLMAECKIHLGKNEEAIDNLETYLQQNPGDTEARIWLGKAFLATNDLLGATQSFEKVEVLEPENAEIPRLLDHIAFMQDSAEYIDAELYDSFQGIYWAEGMGFRSSHTIKQENNRLHYRFEGSLSNDIMYPVGKYRYFSKGTTYNFIPNENKKFDRMGISEAYVVDEAYLNYEVDEGILAAITLFEEGAYEAAEAQFKQSLILHPQHRFLQYYLDHLEFRKKQEFRNLAKDKEPFQGTYATERHLYEIFLIEDQFFLQSATNSRYIDPIPLLPLSKSTFLDTHKLTFRVQFIGKNEKPVALKFLNDFENTAEARYKGR